MKFEICYSLICEYTWNWIYNYYNVWLFYFFFIKWFILNIRKKKTKIYRILFQFIFFCASSVSGQTCCFLKKHRFPFKGHRLYTTFYVTLRNDNAFIFLWRWKSATRGSQSWGYSLSFTDSRKNEANTKECFTFAPTIVGKIDFHGRITVTVVKNSEI